MLDRYIHEKELELLSKAGGRAAKDIDKMSDLDLMMTIQNWLIWLEMPAYTQEEMNRILNTNVTK
jgi:hypothetical protein